MWAHDPRSAQDRSTCHNLCSPGHTNTLLTCTIFHFHRKNPTILAIAEKRIWEQNTNIFIDWVAQIILVWQIKNYFCSSCLPNAMQFQKRYKSKITENTNRWIRGKTIAIQIWLIWINPNILVWVWLYWFCKYMKQTDLKISNYMNRKK